MRTRPSAASPGIQPIAGDLDYGAGASVARELVENTTTNSPVVFDQITVGGDLGFNAATLLSLSFDGFGSLVDWTDAFWSSDQSWTIYDVAGTTTGFSNLSLTTLDWLDGTGNPLSTSQPYAFFSLSQQGSDVVLTYSAVPEPSTLALVGVGAVVAVIASRTRRGRPVTPGARRSRAAVRGT